MKQFKDQSGCVFDIKSENFDAFNGLGWKMPLLGISMTLFMVALTGLPPTSGFVGKFYIFAAVIEAGNQYYWLAFVGVINSVVSLYFFSPHRLELQNCIKNAPPPESSMQKFLAKNPSKLLD